MVAAFGIVIVFAAGHFLMKQVHNFDLYEAVIERERARLGYYGVHLDALINDHLDAMAAGPVGQQYRRRWMRDLDSDKPRRKRRVRLKAVWVWFGALGAILVVDLILLIVAVADLLGDDCAHRYCD